MHTRLGQILTRCGALTAEQLVDLMAEHRKDPSIPLAALILHRGILDDEKLVEHLQRECRVSVVYPPDQAISSDIVALVPRAMAERHHLVPIDRHHRLLTVAMTDPTDLSVLHELKFITRCDIRPVVARDSAILVTIAKIYGAAPETGDERPDTRRTRPAGKAQATEDAPAIRLVQTILADAVQREASDVHIEPIAEGVRVRYRCDGQLQEVHRPPAHLKNALAARIKILGDLDIAERRLPQDGRLKLRLHPGHDVDVRISVLPTAHGEKIVLRILDARRMRLDLAHLGFTEEQLELINDTLRRPHGLILVTGPTGSGKTTTLYAAIEALNRDSRNIVTAEDPIEMEIPGINQVQVDENIGLGFSTALRAFLRQDPDVIMVGEIRDPETAAIAVKAAMTGHLVLSTLHTNDCAASITRLLNMGIEPYLVAASLSLVVAQRLVRRLCPHCRQPDPDECLKESPLPDGAETRAWIPRPDPDCRECRGVGYKGRLALYEAMPVTEATRALILQGAAESDLRQCMLRQGQSSLYAHGQRCVTAGLTSRAEASLVAPEGT